MQRALPRSGFARPAAGRARKRNSHRASCTRTAPALLRRTSCPRLPGLPAIAGTTHIGPGAQPPRPDRNSLPEARANPRNRGTLKTRSWVVPLHSFDFLTQPRDDPALGHVNRADRQTHAVGHLRRRAPFNRRLDECIPGRGLKLAFDAFHRLVSHGSLMIGLPFSRQGSIGIGLLLQALLHPRVARAHIPPAATFQEIEYL